MSTTTANLPAEQPFSRTKSSRWVQVLSWVLSAVPAGMLTFSGFLKVQGSEQSVKMFTEHLGFVPGALTGIALLELACVALYLVPRTAVLGAVLLTGYLGGAMTAHVRIGEPFFLQLGLGLLVWGGLYLRERRLHALLPLRTSA